MLARIARSTTLLLYLHLFFGGKCLSKVVDRRKREDTNRRQGSALLPLVRYYYGYLVNSGIAVSV